jgi:hypothetical protein
MDTPAQQPRAAPSSAEEHSLKSFLLDYLRENHADDDKNTRYFHAFVDLNGDGKNEAIVYIVGRSWCGSGGCPTLVLASDDSSYRVVTEISITNPPIRVLTRTSSGWPNLTVVVSGGGIQPGYEGELRFNGKTYPGNPTVPPARPMAGKVSEKVVIPSSRGGTPLYP